MKKRVLLIVLASFMSMGVVSAASIWGTYKGNQIIRLTVNDQPVKVSDVPAISYNGRTMIPIYLLKEAGIQYSWDQKNQTVDILSFDKSLSVKDILKKYTDAADTYKKLQDFKIELDRSIISLQLLSVIMDQGLNTDVVNKISDFRNTVQSLENRLKQLYDITQNNKKYTGGFVFSVPEMDSILTNYHNTIEDIKSAHLNLAEYGVNKSQNEYNAFLLDIEIANKNSNQAASDSFNGYEFYINLIKKYE